MHDVGSGCGFTTGGLDSGRWRDGTATFGVRLPGKAAVDRSIRERPNLHRGPFAGLVDLEDEGASDEAAF